MTDFKDFFEDSAAADIAALGAETVTLSVSGGSPTAVSALVDEIASDFDPADDSKRARKWTLTFDTADYPTVTEHSDKVTVRTVDATVIARDSLSLGHTVVVAEEETHYARAATPWREME